MLNKEKHQLIMGRILQDMYADTSIASLLGFKGGTCVYFFYGLTRFSVDLDFDLFVTDEKSQQLVYEKVASTLGKYGEIKDQCIKRYTIFFLLSYGDTDHNIKIEINTRRLMPDLRSYYEVKEYLGIPMLIGKKEYFFASKLSALTLRKTVAMRDIYDIWFFAKNMWDIDADVVRARTDKSVKEYLSDCIVTIEGVKDNEILQGLAELLPSEKEKDWAKAKLRTDTIFLLKNYQSVLK